MPSSLLASPVPESCPSRPGGRELRLRNTGRESRKRHIGAWQHAGWRENRPARPPRSRPNGCSRNLPGWRRGQPAGHRFLAWIHSDRGDLSNTRHEHCGGRVIHPPRPAYPMIERHGRLGVGWRLAFTTRQSRGEYQSHERVDSPHFYRDLARQKNKTTAADRQWQRCRGVGPTTCGVVR